MMKEKTKTTNKKEQSNRFQELFHGISQKMRADFEFMSKQLSHSLSVGEVREFAFKEFLRQYLPSFLGVEKGIIISSDEDTSKQIDIVIYDKLNTPVLYAAENLRLFPIEGVYAIIEVKSKLNSASLKDAIDNIRSVKNMTKRAFIEQGGVIINNFTLHGKESEHFPVIGLIFSYSSINLQKLKVQLEQSDDEDVTKNVDSICILNSGLISNIDKKLSLAKELNSRRFFTETKDSLLLFYLMMMHVLPQAKMRPIKMTEYTKDLNFGEIRL